MRARHRIFIAEYLADADRGKAAIRAGYGPENASYVAYRLLQNESVRAALEAELTARAARTGITAERVLREYARIAFADIRAYARWGPDGVTLRAGAELSDDDAAAIAELAGAGEDGEPGKRIRLHDKRRALDMIARHLGLFDRRRAGEVEAAGARAILMRRVAALAGRPASC
jgi:phage terminase small subunit